ncbi:hypothetical protein MKW98_009904 [Papaver atlanticum]|uniref:Coatomer subunit delta n=1 Tax=Papaver atlanticum TaxID=357466 RepID=A0AAD4T3G0_9MAGN|nr:hypothetical protein MKW98_009904 [Papaver atlanticum]
MLRLDNALKGIPSLVCLALYPSLNPTYSQTWRDRAETQCDGKAIGSGSEGENSSLQEQFNKKILKRSSMCYSSGKVDGLIQAQIESLTNSSIHFKTHPNINKELFSNENILGLKDPNRPFPTCPPGDAGVSLLRWRMLSTDESLVPLTINCWPSVCGGDSYVSMEYEASTMFDLHNLVISVPLPALRDTPNVSQVDGDWR